MDDSDGLQNAKNLQHKKNATRAPWQTHKRTLKQSPTQKVRNACWLIRTAQALHHLPIVLGFQQANPYKASVQTHRPRWDSNKPWDLYCNQHNVTLFNSNNLLVFSLRIRKFYHHHHQLTITSAVDQTSFRSLSHHPYPVQPQYWVSFVPNNPNATQPRDQSVPEGQTTPQKSKSNHGKKRKTLAPDENKKGRKIAKESTEFIPYQPPHGFLDLPSSMNLPSNNIGSSRDHATQFMPEGQTTPQKKKGQKQKSEKKRKTDDPARVENKKERSRKDDLPDFIPPGNAFTIAGLEISKEDIQITTSTGTAKRGLRGKPFTILCRGEKAMIMQGLILDKDKKPVSSYGLFLNQEHTAFLLHSYGRGGCIIRLRLEFDFGNGIMDLYFKRSNSNIDVHKIRLYKDEGGPLDQCVDPLNDKPHNVPEETQKVEAIMVQPNTIQENVSSEIDFEDMNPQGENSFVCGGHSNPNLLEHSEVRSHVLNDDCNQIVEPLNDDNVPGEPQKVEATEVQSTFQETVSDSIFEFDFEDILNSHDGIDDNVPGEEEPQKVEATEVQSTAFQETLSDSSFDFDFEDPFLEYCNIDSNL